MAYKYSVLCYIINNYENIHEIKEKDPECEYILVTDDPNLKSETWNVIYDESLNNEKISIFDRCYNIRFNVFKYCSTDICIYIDANVQVNKSLRVLIDKMNDGNYDMVMMPHPFHHNFIDEYKLWIKIRNYPVEQSQKFFKFLVDSNYDMNYKGFFQGTFKIVRRGKINFDFEQLTMSFLKYLGTENCIERLDQTVYSYVLNYYFKDIKILPVSEQILRSEYMTWYGHKSNVKNLNAFYDINKPDIKWMFNKQVECLYLK